MATVGRHNIAFMKSTTSGTGTLTLTTAVRGFLTFALAGVVNGEVVTYTIRDGADTEVGVGTYTTAGTTLSRDTVLSSTNAGAKISCTGRQTVFISVAAEDITPFASYYGNTGDTIANTATDAAITIDTEWSDDAGIASVAANAVTIARKGWYQMTLGILVAGGAAFNGRLEISMSDFGLPVREGYTTAMGIQADMITIVTMINATTNAYSLGTVTFINNLGGSVDVTVNELTVLRLANK
jgi:hypothetical protein